MVSANKSPMFNSLTDDPLLGPIYRTEAEQPSELLHRQFGKSLRNNVETRALKAEGKLKWIIPFVFTLGIILGAAGVSLVVNQAQKTQLAASVASFSSVLNVMEGESGVHRLKQDPQLWLSYIAELLHDEKIEIAEQELAAFKKHYPNYRRTQ